MSNERCGDARVPEYDLKKSSTVTVRLKLPDFSVTILCTLVGEHKSVSGNIEGDRSRSLFSEFQQLTDCSFSNVNPLVKERGHL
jgi:hypothetical protein